MFLLVGTSLVVRMVHPVSLLVYFLIVVELVVGSGIEYKPIERVHLNTMGLDMLDSPVLADCRATLL